MNGLLRHREQGLSLVELLLGLALSALLMATLLPMMQTASAAARATTDQAALERDADFALDRIATRIRASDPANLLAGKTSDQWFNPVVYTVNNNGSLLETSNGTVYVLAESVTGFSVNAKVTPTNQASVVVALDLARGTARTSASVTVRMGSIP